MEMLAKLKELRPPLDFDTDSALGESLSALAETGHQCELDVFLRAADQIEAQGTRAALEGLIVLHREKDGHGRNFLKPHIERLALSLGARIERARDGSNLIIVAPT
jgi:hypothetical protein